MSKMTRRTVTPEDKKYVLSKLDIKLMSFKPKAINSLSSVKFIPFLELQKKFSYSISTVGNSIWSTGLIIKVNTPEFSHCNWKGFSISMYHENKSAKSAISYLQVSNIIPSNSKPDNFSTVFTKIQESMKSVKSKPLNITFDLPLWIKAIQILIEMKLPESSYRAFRGIPPSQKLSW